jgi:hypothetical protein
MKKGIIILSLFLITFSSTAQVYESGTSILSAGYGFPTVLSLRLISVDAADREISSQGPIYLRGEYLASDLISVGIQLAYAKTQVDYSIEYTDANSQLQQGREGCDITNFGVYAEMNFYWLRSGRMALYSGLGAGYNYFNYTEYSDDPNFSSPFGQLIGNAIPLGAQLTMVGAKVNLADGFGVYSNFGFGKSIIEIGLCYGFGSNAKNN